MNLALLVYCLGAQAAWPSTLGKQPAGLTEVASGRIESSHGGEQKWVKLAVRHTSAAHLVEAFGGSVITLRKFDQPSLLRPPRDSPFAEMSAGGLLPEGVEALIAMEADNSNYVAGETSAIQRLSAILKTMDVAPLQIGITARVESVYTPLKGKATSYRLNLKGRTESDRSIHLEAQSQRNTEALNIDSELHQMEISPRSLPNGTFGKEGIWVARVTIRPAGKPPARTVAHRQSFSLNVRENQPGTAGEYKVPLASGGLVLRLSVIATPPPSVKPVPRQRRQPPGHFGRRSYPVPYTRRPTP